MKLLIAAIYVTCLGAASVPLVLHKKTPAPPTPASIRQKITIVEVRTTDSGHRFEIMNDYPYGEGTPLSDEDVNCAKHLLGLGAQ